MNDNSQPVGDHASCGSTEVIIIAGVTATASRSHFDAFCMTIVALVTTGNARKSRIIF